MSYSWLVWMVLSRVTGSPVLSAVGVLGALWVMGRYSLMLPGPVRLLLRWRRAGALERMLHANPHDRRVRYELADLWVGWGRYARAVEVLKPNLAAGDDDVATLYLLGVAYLGAGDAARGELLLDEAEKLEPRHQMGAIDLERGRFRLARGEYPGALEALRRLREARPGTVEGRVLLARALDRSGQEGEAALMREEAWKEYIAAPPFQRRRERLWAWRARPSRPLAYAGALVVGLVLVGTLLGRMADASARTSEEAWVSDDEDSGGGSGQ